MGSLCWKAISMDKLSLILGTFILISFGQDSLLSATSSHEKVESLVNHLDMKFSQMMKEQQEEIKQLQEENNQQQEEINKQKEEIKQLKEENKQQQDDINDMQVDIKRHQEDITSLQKENQDG